MAFEDKGNPNSFKAVSGLTSILHTVSMQGVGKHPYQY
jgi:hypothetical protein